MPMTAAQASFELLARAEMGLAPRFFEVERYRVISERRRNAKGETVVESEAVVTLAIDGGVRTSFYKNEHAQDMQDDGPVNALWQALKSDLGPHQHRIEDVRLTDFKVRITQGGTEAVTRVIIDFADDNGRFWSTVGVSANIVDASFEALLDAVNWKLLRGDDIGGGGGVTPNQAFFTVHKDLPREGPGLADDVLWALKVAETPEDGAILDAACGPGADTVTLATSPPRCTY